MCVRAREESERDGTGERARERASEGESESGRDLQMGRDEAGSAACE